MKTKITFSVLGILAVLVFSAYFAIAVVPGVDITAVNNLPPSVAPGMNYSVSVNIANNLGENISLVWIDVPHASGVTWKELPPNEDLASGTNNDYPVILQVPSDFEGSIQKILRANVSYTNGSLIGPIETSFSVYYVPPYHFCELGESGTLKISDLNIDNFGTGDDEEWEPLDQIEIEVEIENTNKTDDVEDVLVQIKILDSSGSDVTSDFDIKDEEIDLGRIRDDSSETATFVIDEIPADIDDGRYKIYIRAFSEGDEENQCVSESKEFNEDIYQEIKVVRDEDRAIIAKITDSENKVIASCGSNGVIISFPIYNIGVDKEDKVLVNLYNFELGIDEYLVVDSLKSGKKKDVSFFIDVPEGLEKSSYDLKITNYYDYDEDEDEMSIASYDLNSDTDLDKTFTIRLEVLGCLVGKAPTISPSLQSEAKVGTDLIIKTLITNNGDDDNFVISLSDTESWGNIVSLAPQTIKIAKGETRELIIVINPTKEGFHEFKIRTTASGQTHEQSVSVTVAALEKNSFLDTIDNNAAYIIIAVIAILILILLTLIVKVSRRRTKVEY
ncbi:MAG: putative S-layer protein [archaeon]